MLSKVCGFIWNTYGKLGGEVTTNTHDGSMYAIYGNIYHQYTPFMLAYIPYMDPMGNGKCTDTLTPIDRETKHTESVIPHISS